MLYKLTDQNWETKNHTKWGPGIKHVALGPKGQDLCSNGYIHAYTNPLIAVLLNPIHTDIQNPVLWTAKGFIIKTDGQLKCGCYSLTTIERIKLPKFTENQKIYFGILCALEVYKIKNFVSWAENWIPNKDRSIIAAYTTAAKVATYYAAAAKAANAAVAYAANAASSAANAAANADAYYAAAKAATNAAIINKKINFIKFARKAYNFEKQ